MDNQKVKVSILGKSYLLSTDQENNEEIVQAAQMIDSLLRKAVEKMPSTSSDSTAAVLVSLQVASDLIKKERLLQSCEERIEKLVGLLND